MMFIYMYGRRRMKEPEVMLTEHGIKRVFVVLLILRILLEVGTQPAWRSAILLEVGTCTQPAWRSAEAATMANNAQNALSVVEAAGAAKLGTAQRQSEFEPELNVAAIAAKLGTDQRQSEFEPELNVAAGAAKLGT